MSESKYYGGCALSIAIVMAARVHFQIIAAEAGHTAASIISPQTI